MSAAAMLGRQTMTRARKFARSGLTGLGMALCGALVLASGNAQASSSITQTTAWTYDAGTGLMTSQTVQSTATSTSTCISSTGDNTCSVTTTYTRDVYGNITKTVVTGTSLPTARNGSGGTVGTGFTTTTTYDSQGEFATKVTNLLGQSDSWTYSASFGVPLSHIDPNSLSTTWTYDSLGRPLTEAQPDGISSKSAYAYCGGSLICYTNGAYQVQNSVLESGGSTQAAPNSYTTYDTLGRVVETGTQAYNGTTLTSSVVDTQYNSLEQVAQTSNPLFSGGTAVWTTYTYDVLDRVLTQVKPYGTTGSKTSYVYNGLITTGTDAQNRTTTTTDNDMGLPASVQDAAGSTTSYVYDALGDLIQITDPASNVTSYTYDVEGRKIGMVDPDRGSWTYAYDALGNLISQTDAKSQVIAATYDALGRMLTRTQPDQTDGWVYDASSGGTAAIGKLTASQSSNSVNGVTAKLAYVYDGYGRLQSTSGINSVNAATYSITDTYDAGSRISTITYPSGYKVTDAYNGIGNLSSVTGLPKGSSSSQTLWTLNTYSPAGQVIQETLGNGVVVANTYDPNTSLLTATVAGLSTGTQTGDSSTANVANFGYGYDNLGNLTSRSDADADTPNTSTAPTSLSETLAYGNLYQLTNETLPGNVLKYTRYDALGDMTYKSDTGTYSYANTAHVHAVSSIAGHSGTSYDLTTSYTYDANGNQLTGNGYSTVWTSFNMPLSITQGSTTVAYDYDADHNRMSQSGPQGVTEYLSDPQTGASTELLTASSGGSTWTDYLHAGTELISMHVTPATGSAYNRFFIRDHLGSIAVVTGDIGCSGLTLGATNSCLAERDSYDAWGKRRNATTWADDVTNTIASVTNHSFTSHEMVQNTASGYELINMNARMYDPTTGKFMATDPVVQDATNLQDLNAYSYVTNNPLTLTDPTGTRLSGIGGGIVVSQPSSMSGEYGCGKGCSLTQSGTSIGTSDAPGCGKGCSLTRISMGSSATVSPSSSSSSNSSIATSNSTSNGTGFDPVTTNNYNAEGKSSIATAGIISNNGSASGSRGDVSVAAREVSHDVTYNVIRYQDGRGGYIDVYRTAGLEPIIDNSSLGPQDDAGDEVIAGAGSKFGFYGLCLLCVLQKPFNSQVQLPRLNNYPGIVGQPEPVTRPGQTTGQPAGSGGGTADNGGGGPSDFGPGDDGGGDGDGGGVQWRQDADDA